MATTDVIAAANPKGRSWPRMAAWTLVGVLVSGALVLIVLEGMVRVFWPQRAQEDWVAPDARYGHLYKKEGHFRYPFPGSDYVMDMRTNSLGFRDDEPEPGKPGARTVLFLGDSYTMGFGIDVDERFDRRLARLCRQNGAEFRFINTGVDGWGTVHETRYAEDHFDSLRPDIVVLTFCENDPYDDASFLENEGPTKVESGRVRLFLRSHSQLYRFVYVLRWLWGHGEEVRQLGVGEKRAETEDPAAAIAIPEELWQQSLRRLRAFHEAFLRFNPRGVLLVQASAPTSSDVRGHLAGLTNGKDLFYVDLGGPVGALTMRERRLAHDPHWSLMVHEISARALHDRIAELPRPE